MNNTITKQKLEKYFSITKEALDKVKDALDINRKEQAEDCTKPVTLSNCKTEKRGVLREDWGDIATCNENNLSPVFFVITLYS